ncbi:hypothetical protein GCM10010112_30110 [Actinoplanes lobatus]|uniref:Uncharacterized protein n=1 Tax=Actinoplanes lobatus TaxID=113568 RepID=A0ABQ4A991_9ACTN|nr:hypothetical protein GCM10010112_30110 [Actinoplanes lobatus]GIE37365.1 hypothetical protein Alo02nite_02630 [Actinoplanes lobatus]
MEPVKWMPARSGSASATSETASAGRGVAGHPEYRVPPVWLDHLDRRARGHPLPPADRHRQIRAAVTEVLDRLLETGAVRAARRVVAHRFVPRRRDGELGVHPNSSSLRGFRPSSHLTDGRSGVCGFAGYPEPHD